MLVSLSTKFLPIALASLSLISQASAAPGDASIAWADTLLGAATSDDPSTTSDDPNTVLGPPDDQFPALGDLPAPPTFYVWVRDFRPPRTYSKFAEFLGVTDEELTGADVIAFEGNGCQAAFGGGGWESSIWFFSDLTRSYAETFNEESGLGTITTGRRAVFKTGSVFSDAYGSFFGVSVGLCKLPDRPPTPSVLSWLLINVPDDINVHSPNFSVWFGGTGTGLGLGFGSGGPDPDAIGLIGKAPQ